MEEQTIAVDTTEAERATEDAQSSASEAREAAVAATAAAINQGQIIETVTAAAREDAERSRADAAQSANKAEQSAEFSAAVAEVAIQEIRTMLSDYERRLTEVESRNSQPVVVQNEGVSPINPQQTENEEREESMGEGKTEEKSTRRAHGRRKR